MDDSSLAVVAQARPLGARGSRTAVGPDDPASDLSERTEDVLATAAAWWSCRAASARLDGDWLDVRFALQAAPPVALPIAQPSVQGLGSMSGHQLGALYVTSLDSQIRARHGRHYTPPELAESLWVMTRRALGFGKSASRLDGLVRDPACGAGALLLPALREHVAASSATDPHLAMNQIPSLIEGVDSDPAAAWLANVILGAELLPILTRIPEHRRPKLPSLVSVGDGLAPASRPSRAIVMNPPYGRVRLGEADRSRFQRTLYGHANLYALFMSAAVEGLEVDGGVLSALVPTSFTAGRYFEPLRRLLSSEVRLQEINFVEDRSGVFASVLQETCVATFTRRSIRKTSVMSWGSSESYIATVATPRSASPWILPRRSDLATVAATSASLPLTLADLGWRASTGPLVWNRRREDLSGVSTDSTCTVIWATDLTNGTVQLHPSRADRRYLRISTADPDSLRLATPALLVQRTSAPEQSRRLVVAELDESRLEELGGSVVIENHVNVLRPRTASPLSRGLLARLLATDTFDSVARCLSGSVALSAYELESLPLPSLEILDKWEGLGVDELARAVDSTYRTVRNA